MANGVFAGPKLGWYRRDTTSPPEHRAFVVQEPEMVIGDPPYTDRSAREVFGKMREGQFVVFVIKGESPSNLRIAEVLKKE